ncbi:MAG: histidine phosphatase family protein [Chloroflexi bacterium]|nr:histidine phosphatase family protein [Chloroflexota bacterium]MCC6893334.1 histidine phosphatase family protein [Anaerolineae bacterium]
MELYFFRHGQAEDAQGPDFDDFARSLTDKGVERTQAAGRALLRLNIKPVRLYTSPRLRARQTAEILGAALGITSEARDEVNFGFNPHLIPAMLTEIGNDAAVMFVGHEPDLSITVGALTGGGEVEMKKGGMARVDLLARSPLRGMLMWLIAPRVLDVIGG